MLWANEIYLCSKRIEKLNHNYECKSQVVLIVEEDELHVQGIVIIFDKKQEDIVEE